MAAALYRINFELRGNPRSLLKMLHEPPSVGGHLALEHLSLVVTEVTPEPVATGIAATVRAKVAGSGEAA